MNNRIGFSGNGISSNTLSGNGTGVQLNDASNVVIASNHIGTTPDEMSALGNRRRSCRSSTRWSASPVKKATPILTPTSKGQGTS